MMAEWYYPSNDMECDAGVLMLDLIETTDARGRHAEELPLWCTGYAVPSPIVELDQGRQDHPGSSEATMANAGLSGTCRTSTHEGLARPEEAGVVLEGTPGCRWGESDDEAGLFTIGTDPETALLHRAILGFRDRQRRAGRRLVGPPSEGMLAQAIEAVDLLAQGGARPYRAILSADCTVGLLVQASHCSAEIECGGEEGVGIELEYCHDGVRFEHFVGPTAASEAVRAILLALGAAPYQVACARP